MNGLKYCSGQRSWISGQRNVAAAKKERKIEAAKMLQQPKSWFSGQKDPAVAKRILQWPEKGPIGPTKAVPVVPKKRSQWIQKPRDGYQKQLFRKEKPVSRIILCLMFLRCKGEFKSFVGLKCFAELWTFFLQISRRLLNPPFEKERAVVNCNLLYTQLIHLSRQPQSLS